MIQIENDVTAFEDVAINGVSIDSRKITPGNLFVPFKGEHSDGHRFVEDAIEKRGSMRRYGRRMCQTHLCICRF